MLKQRKFVLSLVFITGVFYSENSFCENNTDHIQSSCKQIIKNPIYSMCDEQKLTDGTICYIDSNKIMPGQTSIGYQKVQAKLHDISKENNKIEEIRKATKVTTEKPGIPVANQTEDGPANIVLENIINYPSPVLLLDETLIPADYKNTGKLPIILLDAHHRTVALMRWKQSIEQQQPYCRLIKTQTDASVNDELKAVTDKNEFWKILNKKGYSDVEDVDSYNLDFLKLTNYPIRSLFGINPDKENIVADYNIYSNILETISAVNFKEFIISKKLVALINKNNVGANEILNLDNFYSNQETKAYCSKKVMEDIVMDLNRKMGKKAGDSSYIDAKKAQIIRENAEDILHKIDIKHIATHWDKEYWEDNSVEYKVLKCYMENLHTFNSALSQALTALWRLNSGSDRKIPTWKSYPTNTPNKALSHTILQPDDKLLTILQYNIQQRPFVDNGIRSELSTFYIPPAIKQFNADVVTVNEAFTAALRPRLVEEMKAIGYTYSTNVLGNSGGALWSGGVMIFSKYPFTTSKEHIFTHFASMDKNADKGVLYAQINKNGMKYNIFASHTNASYTFKDTRLPLEDEGRRARSGEYQPTTEIQKLGQFTEIRDFIKEQKIPSNEPVIIIGDLNVDMLSEKWQANSEYDQMLQTLNAIHPKITGLPYTLNSAANEWANPEDGPKQYLDYILYSKEYLIPRYSSNRAICLKSDGRYYDTDSCSKSQNKIKSKREDLPKSRRDLSDHFPVLGTFDFN